jgi:methyl-accepting chemotaxis protein
MILMTTNSDPYTFFNNINPFVLVCVGITAILTSLGLIVKLFSKPIKLIHKALKAIIAIYNVIFGYIDPNTHEEIDGLINQVKEIKSDVAEVKSDVAEVKSDVAEVKSDVAEVKSDVSDVKNIADQANNTADNHKQLNAIETRQKTIEKNTKQLTPNGGTHMLDTINKINATVNPEINEIKEQENE